MTKTSKEAPKESSSFTAYLWQGNKFLDSYSPLCSMVHRVFAYKKIDYSTKFVTLNEQVGTVMPAMKSLPVVDVGEKKILDLVGLARLVERSGKEHSLYPEDKKLQAQNIIYTNWATTHMLSLSRYFRLKMDDNWEGLIDAFRKQGGGLSSTLGLEEVKGHLLHNLLLTPIGRCKADEAYEHLILSLDQINALLLDGEFLLGDKPYLCDFCLFGVLQALVDPCIKEARMITERYPSIIEWLRRVDKVSRNQYTKNLRVG